MKSVYSKVRTFKVSVFSTCVFQRENRFNSPITNEHSIAFLMSQAFIKQYKCFIITVRVLLRSDIHV